MKNKLGVSRARLIFSESLFQLRTERLEATIWEWLGETDTKKKCIVVDVRSGFQKTS